MLPFFQPEKTAEPETANEIGNHSHCFYRIYYFLFVYHYVVTCIKRQDEADPIDAALTAKKSYTRSTGHWLTAPSLVVPV